MNNATRWATAALVAVSLTTASTARAAIQVAVLDGRFHASADDKLGFASREFADPANGNVTLEALDGSAYSRLRYSLTTGEYDSVLRFDMDQSLGAAAVHTNGYAHVIFTLTETVNFEISGAFSGGGSRDSTTQYLLVANLANTSSGYLYDEYEQTPQNATGALLFPNNRQDYVGSDYGNAYQQLTGGLAPGVYQFYQAGSLYDPTPDAGTVAARGFTQLRLWVDPPGGGDPVPAVPEPSSLVIFGLGALCCLGPLDCGSHKHCMTNRRFSRQPRWLLLDSRESLSLLAGLAGGPPWRRTKLA